MNTTSQEIDIRTRQRLATNIVTWGLGVVGLLSLAIIVVGAVNGAARESSQLVLTATLPLVGTWVGTVLAFYFAKENFEAASKATKEILGLEEKLRSIPVSTVMIPVAKIDAFQLGKTISVANRQVSLPAEADEILLTDALNFLEEKERNRLPILDGAGVCLYIIHLSMLDRFRSRQLRDPAKATAQAGWRLRDLRTDDPKSFEQILAWACVAETASLADAKHAMDTTPGCNDVVVTKTGKGDSPVIGWLTNVEIAQNSKA